MKAKQSSSYENELGFRLFGRLTTVGSACANRVCVRSEIKTQQSAIIIIVKRGAYKSRQIATLEARGKARGAPKQLRQSQRQRQRQRKLAATSRMSNGRGVYNDLWANVATKKQLHTDTRTHVYTKMAHIRDRRNAQSSVCDAS